MGIRNLLVHRDKKIPSIDEYNFETRSPGSLLGDKLTRALRPLATA